MGFSFLAGVVYVSGTGCRRRFSWCGCKRGQRIQLVFSLALLFDLRLGAIGANWTERQPAGNFNANHGLTAPLRYPILAGKTLAVKTLKAGSGLADYQDLLSEYALKRIYPQVIFLLAFLLLFDILFCNLAIKM